MNALSSIRPLLPGTSTTALMGTDRVAGGGTSIPSAELRQLNACSPASSSAAVKPADGSFSGLVGQMIQDVNAKQNAASQALQDLQSGQSGSLHQAMIATEEASVSFQMMVEVRNRMLDAYQEIMRMQV